MQSGAAHKSTARAGRTQRGAVAVEVGFLLPLVLLALLAMIDFGRYLWVHDVVGEAAAQSLRMAVLTETDNAQVAEAAHREIERGGLHAPASVSIGPREPGTYTNVSVSVDFSFLFLPDISKASSWVVTASAEGICER